MFKWGILQDLIFYEKILQNKTKERKILIYKACWLRLLNKTEIRHHRIGTCVTVSENLSMSAQLFFLTRISLKFLQFLQFLFNKDKIK